MEPLETVKLGPPYKFVKTRDYTLCNQNGELHGKSKVHLYLDPRGSSSFVIALPPYMKGLVKGKYMIFTKDGVDTIASETAEGVMRQLYSLTMAYVDAVRTAEKKEVIAFSFIGIVPKFHENGSVIDQQWEYKPPNQRYGGSAGQELCLEFIVIRGFKVGEKFCVFENGQLSEKGGFSGHMLPYTPATWEALLSVRKTITEAILSLAKVFGTVTDPHHIVALLMESPYLALSDDSPAPVMPAPPPARPYRRRR